MAAHQVFPVQEPTQVGEARRAAARLAESQGLDSTAAGRLALVVTELGTNLFKHASTGRLLLGIGTEAESPYVEVLSLDHGPGMADVDRCLRDGYSTAGSQGTGLGAVKRLADRFSVFSLPGQGTVIAARVGVAPAQRGPAEQEGFDIGAVAVAAPGETACGDAWAFRPTDRHAGAVMVADGLGHGPTAEEAALGAIAVFDASQAGPAQTLARAHEKLRSTRGAAVAMAVVDGQAGSIVFAGAGNIAGRVISGVEDRSMLSQHGTVGFQMRTLQENRYDWPAHAIVVLHSDGLATRWSLKDTPGVLQCDAIVIAAWLLLHHIRGRDDATVVVIRRGQS